MNSNQKENDQTTIFANDFSGSLGVSNSRLVYIYTTDLMSYRQPCSNEGIETALIRIEDTFNHHDLDAFVAGHATDPDRKAAWGDAMSRLIEPQREVLTKSCEAPYSLGVTVIDIDVVKRDEKMSDISYTVAAVWGFANENDAMFYEMQFVNAGVL